MSICYVCTLKLGFTICNSLCSHASHMLYYYCYVHNYKRSTFDLQSSTVPAGSVIDDDNSSIVHDDNTSMLYRIYYNATYMYVRRYLHNVLLY